LGRRNFECLTGMGRVTLSPIKIGCGEVYSAEAVPAPRLLPPVQSIEISKWPAAQHYERTVCKIQIN
jgi:hypothetical protein